MKKRIRRMTNILAAALFFAAAAFFGETTSLASEQVPLVFIANGGRGSMEQQMVTVGDRFRFPECGFEAPEGKVFNCWHMSGLDGLCDPDTEVLIAENCVTDGRVECIAKWKNAPYGTASVATKPEGKQMEYSGTDRELVSAGEAENGTLVYTIGTDDVTEPVSGWSEEIPEASKIGTYYVWYKAKGSNGYADSKKGCAIAVITEKKPVRVTGLTLSASELNLKIGEEAVLTAAVLPEDAENKTVTWSIDQKTIASVDAGGKVKGLAQGEALITAKTEDGGFTASCRVSVKEDAPDVVIEKEPGETLLTKMVSKGKNSFVITWDKVEGAQGYDVFFAKCGGKKDKSKLKLEGTVKGDGKRKWTKKGLKKSTAYKAYIKAWIEKDGKKQYICTGPTVHAFSSGGSKAYTNPKSVRIKKKSLTLQVGKQTKAPKATVAGLSKGKKLIPSNHAPQIRYMSSDKKIATVDKKGKIAGKAAGECKIYVYAANGISAALTVTVL